MRSKLKPRPIPASLAGIALALGIAGCAGSPAKDHARTVAREGMVTRSDFEIVECLLPGQVRQIAGTTYLTQRRPTRTTVADCRVRGGEYVLYDRADVKSALRIWLATAQSGDAAAENNVGEIYERGVGSSPDYAAAALWYGKAAKQGYSRALLNLGMLYEQGLGVEKDPVKALNFYRMAAGIPQNSVVWESAARGEADALRAQLKEKDGEIDALEKQVNDVARKLSAESRAASAYREQSQALESLRTLVKELQAERNATQQRIASLGPTRGDTGPAQPPPRPLDPNTAIRTVMGENIGRFYALIIADQDYQNLAKLSTPLNDAARAAQILRHKYGFTVQVIDDASDVGILRALNDLDRVLRPDDNLLIYYAGHGWRIQAGPQEVGYWLPVNAQPPPNDTFWVPNAQVVAHMGRLRAKRILVVADSCFAGLLSTDPSVNLFGAQAGVTAAYLKYILPKRARLLIASGGDDPVLDAGGQGHSVFAQAFLDSLDANSTVLTTEALFADVRARMDRAAMRTRFNEKPDLRTIRSAGHEMGDFFFVPVGPGQ
ncbi:MAG: caspase family protein [Steroidobacteraceae bacterium]